jgi:hypothetical protein
MHINRAKRSVNTRIIITYAEVPYSSKTMFIIRVSPQVKFVSCLSANLLVFFVLAGKSQQTASLLSADNEQI